MIQIFRAKLHGLHVTGADVDYHGSITLDPAHCRLAGIHPLEFVGGEFVAVAEVGFFDV